MEALNDLKPLPPGSTKIRLVVEVDGDRPVVELAKALGGARAHVVGVLMQEDAGEPSGLRPC